MANRIYFANQQVSFKRDGATGYTTAHGVQSVAVTTTFNLEQAFELGQLAIYENIEGVPDIEVPTLGLYRLPSIQLPWSPTSSFHQSCN